METPLELDLIPLSRLTDAALVRLSRKDIIYYGSAPFVTAELCMERNLPLKPQPEQEDGQSK